MEISTEIKDEFRAIENKNPGWSSHTCFLHLVRNKKYTYEEVDNMFSEFVEKNDYSNSYREKLVDYAFRQTRKVKPVSVFKKKEEYANQA